MYSQRISQKHEFTGVLHAKAGAFDGEIGVIPGAAIGVALGDDTGVNVLRLEAGYNVLNQITFGLGWQFLSTSRSNSRHQDPESVGE